MTRIARLLVLAASAGAVALLTLPAEAAGPPKVFCSPAKKLQKAIDAAKAGVTTTISVSGVCNENIVVPSGKTIVLVGSLSGTSIVAADGSRAALRTLGSTTIQNITLQNNGGSADSVVEARDGGVLKLNGVNVTGPSVEAAVGVWSFASASITNSHIGSGASAAVEVFFDSSAWISGTDSEVQGPDGFKTTLDGKLNCNPGSSVYLRANNTKGQDGKFAFSGTQLTSVYAQGCSLSIVNNTSNPDNLLISGGTYAGIQLDTSTLRLQKAKVSGNSGFGIAAQLSSVDIMAAELSGNTRGDVQSGPGSSVAISSFWGKSNLPDAFAAETLTCWPAVNSGAIFAESTALTVPAGHVLNDIFARNPCLTKSD